MNTDLECRKDGRARRSARARMPVLVLLYSLLLACPITASARIRCVLPDAYLVEHSDVILVGEQVDAVTVKVRRVLLGYFTNTTITLRGLSDYKRQMFDPRAAGLGKLDSAEILLFIDCRSVPCRILDSGVKRFSFEPIPVLYYSVPSEHDSGSEFHVARNQAGTTREKYLATLEPLIEAARVRHEQSKAAMLMAAMNSANPEQDRHAFGLGEMRNPFTAQPLIDYVMASLEGDKPVSEQIRAVGSIGGLEALPFLLKLAAYKTNEPDRKSVRSAAIQGLRSLSCQLEIGSADWNALANCILSQSPEAVAVRESLVELGNAEAIAALEKYADRVKDHKALYPDALRFIEQAKARMRSTKESANQLDALRKEPW